MLHNPFYLHSNCNSVSMYWLMVCSWSGSPNWVTHELKEEWWLINSMCFFCVFSVIVFSLFLIDQFAVFDNAIALKFAIEVLLFYAILLQMRKRLLQTLISIRLSIIHFVPCTIKFGNTRHTRTTTKLYHKSNNTGTKVKILESVSISVSTDKLRYWNW